MVFFSKFIFNFYKKTCGPYKYPVQCGNSIVVSIDTLRLRSNRKNVYCL
jgi:hypothetical protein